MELRSIVKLFERVGAKCRKLRGKPVYECWRNDIKATISPEKIEIRSIGEFRLEYSDFTPEGYLYEKDFFEDLKEATGAKTAYLDFPGDIRADIVLEYDPDKAERAAKIFKKMAEHEMWAAVTNIRGELRLYKDHDVAKPDDWFSVLEES